MAGKPWTKERHAEEAARRANQAAQKVQESGVKPVFQPDNDIIGGEATRVQTKNPNWSVQDEIDARSDERSGMQPDPEEQAETPAAAAEPTEPEQAPTTTAEHSTETPSTPEAPAAAPDTPEPPKTVKVKVDGEEIEVSQAEIDEAGGVAAYRTLRAADNRLKKANEILTGTRQTQAQVAQWAQQQVQVQQPQHTEAQLLEYVRTGTPEQANAAWALLKQGMSVDRAAITNESTFKSVQRGAIEKFQAEFQDVLANPHLARLAATYENERLPKAMHESGLLQWNGAQWVANWADPRVASFDFSKVYRSIGNELRSLLPRQSQPQQPGTTTGTSSQPSEKEARKASIVTLPAAGRVAPPAEEKPQTHREILAEEAKARGKVAPHG